MSAEPRRLSQASRRELRRGSFSPALRRCRRSVVRCAACSFDDRRPSCQGRVRHDVVPFCWASSGHACWLMRPAWRRGLRGFVDLMAGWSDGTAAWPPAIKSPQSSPTDDVSPSTSTPDASVSKSPRLAAFSTSGPAPQGLRPCRPWRVLTAWRPVGGVPLPGTDRRRRTSGAARAPAALSACATGQPRAVRAPRGSPTTWV